MEEPLVEWECRGFVIGLWRFGIQVACVMCAADRSDIVKLFGWTHLAFGLFAAGAGIIVLRGVFQRTLSSASTVRFLRWSLVASLAGLMPLAHHLTPVQQICMVSVYCSGAAIIAWLKFGLVGRSRRIFALSVTGVLYFDVVFVATRLFGNPPLFTVPLANPLPSFQLVEILFAAAFIVLGIVAVKKCGPNRPGGRRSGGLGTLIEFTSRAKTLKSNTYQSNSLTIA